MMEMKRQARAETVRKILDQSGAVITGTHVVYTSGKHGDTYVNKDGVYPDPRNVEFLCGEIANDFALDHVEVVVGPVHGAIVLAYDVARALSKNSGRKVQWVYAEKEYLPIPDPEERGRKCLIETGNFVVKRGYDKLLVGKRVLIIDDIFTTGGTVKKIVKLVRALGGNVIGVEGLVNRGGVTAEMIDNPDRFETLLDIDLSSWEEGDCELCAKDVPVNTEVGKGREFLAKRQSQAV